MFGSYHSLTIPHLSTVLEHKYNDYITVGSAGVQGCRGSMEDAHCIIVEDSRAIVGVFDGHAGHECSAAVSKMFAERAPALAAPYTTESIKNMCDEIDTTFMREHADTIAGSTGTFAYVDCEPHGSMTSYNVVVGNVGDSRVNLYVRRSGTCMSMTNDHKPTLPSEKKRIEAAGGTVEFGRVNGSLAVSRAFGDAPFKYGAPPHPVIAEPDVTRREVAVLSACDEYILVLACDGLFETDVTNDDVGNVIRTAPAECDAAHLAYLLCNHATRAGSGDNVSIIVVRFHGRGHLPVNTRNYVERLPGPFRKIDDQYFVQSYLAWIKANDYETLTHALTHRRDLLHRDDALRHHFFVADVDDVLMSSDTNLDELAADLIGRPNTYMCTKCNRMTKTLKCVKQTVESSCPACEDDTEFKLLSPSQTPPEICLVSSNSDRSTGDMVARFAAAGLLNDGSGGCGAGGGDDDDEDFMLPVTPNEKDDNGDNRGDHGVMSPNACTHYEPWHENECVCGNCRVPEFQHP
eukprot:PhM_4_TR17269/c0_g1_i1/m.6096/K14803/PTC2_3; protein phosphatase PTC2/3